MAESLVAAFAGHDLAGKRILLPRAAVARDLAPAELSKRGARVDVVEAYRTGVPLNMGARVRQVFFGDRQPDWITFTSSSTVTNFVQAAGSHDAGGGEGRLHRPGDFGHRSQVRNSGDRRGLYLHHRRFDRGDGPGFLQSPSTSYQRSDRMSIPRFNDSQARSAVSTGTFSETASARQARSPRDRQVLRVRF